jgi:hypothetical protein
VFAGLEFDDEKESIRMLDMVIGAVIVLIAAVMAIFLILIAINIALVRKLRSLIPHSPAPRPRPNASER